MPSTNTWAWEQRYGPGCFKITDRSCYTAANISRLFWVVGNLREEEEEKKMAVMGKLRMFVVQEPVVAASCLIAGFGDSYSLSLRYHQIFDFMFVG